MPASPRQLAAIMLTDMVGYASLTQRDEELAVAMVREHERIVRPRVRSARGRVIKALGDGLLVEFPDALSAVRCALLVQTAVEERNSKTRAERLELRIGVHLGDVVHRAGDVFGDAVNIAARIQPLAEPGGVVISQQVYDQVRNKLPQPFESIGTPRLKHIETPVGVYRLGGPHPAAAPAPEGERPRVAVLPLANLSGKSEDEFFADGITEELIQTLSRVGGLRVLARSSMMRFKNSARSPAEIARELGVSAVVEGSIRRAGAQLRVTARLVDTSTEESLWSQEYDREVRDVFAVQSDISERIASALQVEILGGERRVIERPATRNVAAHTIYLEGRYLLNQRTEASLKAALERFGQAIREDPGFALAHTGLSDTYSTLAWLEFLRPRFAFPRARAAAKRAIALDPASAEAHTSLGFVLFLYERSWVEAESEFRRAIALNPNYPTAHQFYSDYLKAMGRLEEAQVEVRRALELDPLSLGINTALGHVLYLSREYDAAIEQYQRALRLDPNFAQAHLWFGRPYLEKRRFPDAIREVEQAVRLSKESTMSLSVLGHVYAAAGRRDAAERILRRLVQRSRSQYVPSYWIALIQVGLGRRASAFTWLDRANRERSAWLAWVKVEPRFDSLRSDPRFATLLRRLKLA